MVGWRKYSWKSILKTQWHDQFLQLSEDCDCIAISHLIEFTYQLQQPHGGRDTVEQFPRLRHQRRMSHRSWWGDEVLNVNQVLATQLHTSSSAPLLSVSTFITHFPILHTLKGLICICRMFQFLLFLIWTFCLQILEDQMFHNFQNLKIFVVGKSCKYK